jgi:hypothetical protein
VTADEALNVCANFKRYDDIAALVREHRMMDAVRAIRTQIPMDIPTARIALQAFKVIEGVDDES